MLTKHKADEADGLGWSYGPPSLRGGDKEVCISTEICVIYYILCIEDR